jgi:hypothetical protein
MVADSRNVDIDQAVLEHGQTPLSESGQAIAAPPRYLSGCAAAMACGLTSVNSRQANKRRKRDDSATPWHCRHCSTSGWR